MSFVRALVALLLVLASATAMLATWHRRYAERASAAEAAMLAQLAARGRVDAATYAIEYADSSFGTASEVAVVPEAFVQALRAGGWRHDAGTGFMLLDSDWLGMLLPHPRQAAIRTADGGAYQLMVYSAGRSRWTMYVSGVPTPASPTRAASVGPEAVPLQSARSSR